MNTKVVWTSLAVSVVILLGYLASRVGNIGARSLRSGEAPIVLGVSEPIVPGVDVSVRWNTSLGSETGSVVLKAKNKESEIQVGEGELGAGRAMIVIPCTMAGGQVGLGLYEGSQIGPDQLLTQRLVQVLPAGPDCLR